jgi:superfamily I DNA and/or RNA helicase
MFDAMIVDEATQACEPSVLVALQHVAHLCILVGDHKQLPPTVKSAAASAGGLGVSLFERLLACGMAAPRCACRVLVWGRAHRGHGRV